MFFAGAVHRACHVPLTFYRLWKPHAAKMDLCSRAVFRRRSALHGSAELRHRFRVSIFSPAGVPVFPLKTLIPITGVLLLLQGIAEIIRCILCIRTGEWPQRLHDVEETESIILQEKKIQQERGIDADSAQPLPGHKGTGA